MRKIFERIETALRGLCGRLTPDMRIYTIVALVVILAVVNIWLTFSAIYSIGREDRRIEQIQITPLTVPDFMPEQDTENHFEPHLKTEENDTTEIESKL